MKRNIYFVTPSTTIREAIRLFLKNHIGTLPVVNEGGHLVGLLLIRDVLSLVMPDFIHLIKDFDFIPNFGAAEEHTLKDDVLEKPISTIMESPISLEETSGLLRSAAMINQQNLGDIPVVDSENRLVGIASRVDIGTALLMHWRLDKGA
jgi:CBS domain-containing protein